MKKIIILISFSALLSCERGSDTKIIEAQNGVMQNADLDSYMKLTNEFKNENNFQNILPYALKMQKHGAGYHDFFYNYIKIEFDNKFDSKNILKLEKPEKDFLIYILYKGAKAGEPDCKNILIDYYKNGFGVEQNAVKADSIYKTFGYPATYKSN